MTCAIDDAGFEVRDMIEWVYGSGFPKSLNIGKAVDKLQGNEREVVGRSNTVAQKSSAIFQSFNGADGANLEHIDGNLPTTKGTSEWEGWGTALKPAHEPICMARKPLAEKTVAQNVLKYGTGGINIDESRVDVADTEKEKYLYADHSQGNSNPTVPIVPSNYKRGGGSVLGRFPANLIHDNSEEVRECFPETH
jgi:site-specific DNA-methyltransferase (adenine-specific)